ncbi:MAG: hypothetical protein ACMUEM_03975 [Flavobacteriales bacterium AspAUS03]
MTEWITDVYRHIIDNETNDINYFKGNIYKKFVLKDGLPEYVANESEYDILAGGCKIYKSLLESIKKEVNQNVRNY